MKRIMILGSAGSGKSTLARIIGEVTGIEVLHLDTLFWKPGWVETPKEKFVEAVRNHILKDSWITDGNYYDYPKKNKPEILTKIQTNSEGKEVYYLKSRKEIDCFIKNVKSNYE